ncbi:MAG: holo-ACP synthase [Marmoricola sp.]
MIVGVGTDLVEVARLEQALERTPTLRHRLFTPAEADLPLESLAARFAAKEALAKALGAPAGLSWQDAEVVTDPGGRPSFSLTGAVARQTDGLDVHLSLSHDGGMALAFVVLESGAPGRARARPEAHDR